MTNIKKGLKLKGSPAEIPDTTRLDLPEFFKEMGFKVGVEIGVYKGIFTKEFCDAGIKMFGIDPWIAYKNYRNRKKFTTKNLTKYQKRQDLLYNYTLKHLKEYIDSGLCEIIRKTSMDAVGNFEDESLDFVYIDGNHGFKFIAEDLVEWSKKVKRGGVVSGHDYIQIKNPPDHPDAVQVIHVLHAYIKAFGIDNFYVLGRKKIPGKRISKKNYDIYVHSGKEEKRDRWRSWFWIK
jgi:hypothetical protein